MAQPTTIAPTPTHTAANVVSIYSDTYTNVGVSNFNPDWNQNGTGIPLMVGGGNVLHYTNFNYQGTELTEDIDLTQMDTLHIDMWTADATTVTVTPVNRTGTPAEYLVDLAPITQGSWQSYDIPLAAFTAGGMSRNAVFQMKFAGGDGAVNLYLDNIYFYKSSVTEPTTVAPTPTCPQADVISIFSDAYTDVGVSEFNPDWGQSGTATMETIAGGNVLKYANFNYQGTQLAVTHDVSQMEYLHVDLWTADATSVKVTPVNNGGNPAEYLVALTPINQGSWNSFEIPLSAFTDSGMPINAIHQLKFDGQEGENPSNIYLDNIYFSKDCVTPIAPTTAAPTPTCNAADVVSIFSDTYTDVAISEINPNWNQSGSAAIEMIAGGSVLKYANFNYQGTQLAGAHDLSEMTFLHVDLWTADATSVKVTPINNGGDPAENLVALSPINQGSWNSYEIPLSAFTANGMSMDAIHQMKFDGLGGTNPSNIYLDNIYFSKGCIIPPPPMSEVLFAVDMNAYAADFTTVYVSGNFNDWSGTANPLSDIDGDGVWTGTVSMPHGQQEYKFTLDDNTVQENFSSGGNCTLTTGMYTNRVLTISGTTEVCYAWETCTACTCPILVWSDEFDGSELDLSKWTPQIGDGCAINLCGWGNQELQYYRSENATVADGKLTITAKSEAFGGRDYTSSRLRSINQGDWTYGRFEASIKMPFGQGLWPAFWMMPTDDVYGTWPRSGEIDIMEYLGHKPNEVFGTIHFGSSFETRRFIGNEYHLPSGNFNEDFHLFAIEWEENEIRWYVDNILFATRTASEIAPDNWPFDQRFHFILNVAVGGNFPGSPDGTTTFPQIMEVDYVRVYKGGFPTIKGETTVLAQTTGEVYTIENATAGTAYNWTVPNGVTITAGQGTSAITVNWGGNSSSGSLIAADDCSGRTLRLDVTVTTPESVLENFDMEATIAYQSSSGTLTDNTNNPNTNGGNNSALVGQYCRNAEPLYDAITYVIDPFADASRFVGATKKFYLDVYTDAPIGTEILLQLENDAQATPENWPEGRHSRYNVKTTTQNEWERLVFDYVDQPSSVANNIIDNLVLLFNPNSNTNHCYYFDNFEIYCAGTNCETNNDCPENLAVNDADITNKTYRGTNIISTGIVESGSEVTFAAVSNVTLNAGFHAKIGADFTAKIEACSTTLQEAETAEPLERTAPMLNIEKIAEAMDIKVFPNPMHHQLTVKLQAFDQGQLRLMDATGKNHLTRIISGVAHLNVSELPAGIYFLQVWDKTSGKIFNRKIVRQP